MFAMSYAFTSVELEGNGEFAAHPGPSPLSEIKACRLLRRATRAYFNRKRAAREREAWRTRGRGQREDEEEKGARATGTERAARERKEGAQEQERTRSKDGGGEGERREQRESNGGEERKGEERKRQNRGEMNFRCALGLASTRALLCSSNGCPNPSLSHARHLRSVVCSFVVCL
jgi:hypothetical protein